MNKVLVSLCVLACTSASAQQAPLRFTGLIASTQTTRPVGAADIRLIYVDSMKRMDAQSVGLGEVYVDSAKSRAGITDENGNFRFAGISPGHYLMQVRRIGFAPFEGIITLDTASIEMELALDQMVAILPRMTINANAVDRVNQKLERAGFLQRSKFGSGTYIKREDVLKQHDLFVQDLLERWGVPSNAVVTMDRVPIEWETLRDYPIELVVGVEIYRRSAAVPIEFGQTRTGANALGRNGSGGIPRVTVLIWTYIP